jgi:hypothetical protein
LLSSKYVKRDSRTAVAAVLLLVGALALLWSIYFRITVLAFVGLGLTFWGTLFLLLGTPREVEAGLLYDVATSEYFNINRIVNDLNYVGEAIYMSPYPKSIHVPDHQKSLKEPIVFISQKKNTQNLSSAESNFLDLGSIEERGAGKFLLKNGMGLFIVPPGLGILKDVENSLKIDFTKMDTMQFCQLISQVLLEKFNLAKAIETEKEGNIIKMKIRNSIYRNLFTTEDNLTSIHLLGCPMTSAIAVGLTKASNKNVSIINEIVSNDNQIVEVWYKIYD